MLKSFVKIAWRNLLRNQLTSIINIIGLSTGIAISYILFLHIMHEFSYDKFHEYAEDKYRIILNRIYPQNEIEYAITPISIGEVVTQEFPEVKSMCRILIPRGEFIIKTEGKAFKETDACFADSNLFDFFNIPLIYGDNKTILRNANSIIITESIAKKYFGETNAIGKILSTPNGNLTVEAVCADVPDNCHLRFNFISPLKASGLLNAPSFIAFSTNTYIQLHKGIDPLKVETKFPELILKYASSQVEKQLGISYDDYVKAGNGYEYFLQPVQRIHLYSNLKGEIQENGNILNVIIYISIAVIILFIACINYIHLSTAKSADRAKEVGIRKLLGSERKKLIYQFLIESFLVTVLSTFFAIFLIELFTPVFNYITESTLSLEIIQQFSSIFFLLSIVIVIGILAGIFPAVFMSSFMPIAVIKGRFLTSKKGILLRNTLVIMQFSVSTILLIAVLHINKQVKFLKNINPGYNKENIIIIDRANTLGDKSKKFKEKVFQLKDVNNASYSYTYLTGGYYFGVFFQTDLFQSEPFTTFGTVVDDSFFKTMGLHIIDGKSFSKENNDSLFIIINESAVKSFNLSDPVGKEIYSPALNNQPTNLYKIIGVVNDFHYNPLHDSIKSFVFFSNESVFNLTPFLNIKLKSEITPFIIDTLERIWKELLPDEPFSYIIYEEYLQSLYQYETKLLRIVGILTLIAILIASIGLFGLSSFIAEKKSKEVGIRKAFGATIFETGLLIAKNILVQIFISLIIALPITYLFIYKWLDKFAYAINIDFFLFLTGGIIILVIVIITISYHVLKVSHSNPVQSLRYE